MQFNTKGDPEIQLWDGRCHYISKIKCLRPRLLWQSRPLLPSHHYLFFPQHLYWLHHRWLARNSWHPWHALARPFYQPLLPWIPPSWTNLLTSPTNCICRFWTKHVEIKAYLCLPPSILMKLVRQPRLQLQKPHLLWLWRQLVKTLAKWPLDYCLWTLNGLITFLHLPLFHIGNLNFEFNLLKITLF